MNLEELQSVQSTERQRDSLQQLRPTFYEEVGEYITNLEAERDRIAEEADDPFSSPEVAQLTNEIETARDVVEAIYERRMGKLVKQASLSAAGLNADDEGLTAEERDLFDDLVARIQTNKSRVLSVLAGEDVETATSAAGAPDAGGDHTDGEVGADGPAGGNPAADPTPGSPTEHAPEAPPEPTADEVGPSDPDRVADDAGVSAADVMGGDPGASADTAQSVDDDSDAADATGASTADSGSDPASTASTDSLDVDRMTVRITTDVGSILGVDDREYTLEREDVVTLPEQNAEPLVARDAAERIDQ